MNIKLISISLRNFKGKRELDIAFNDTTDIYGANGTGKTTIVDAFNFLLWGKNSIGQKEFNIKTLDENNNPIHKLEHEVSALLLVDGAEVRLKRVYKETWAKKRGESEAVFTGHETLYYWNDVPMKQVEYQTKINSIVDENLFKLLSNTNYFASLKWQDQRNILIGLAGEIDNSIVLDKIATAENDFSNTINVLNSGKTIDEFKKEIAAKKKKLKDELELIPARIDEAKRSMPENTDFSDIEKQIEAKNSELNQLVKSISDLSEAAKQENQAKLDIQNQLFGLRSKKMDAENAIKTSVKSLGSDSKSKVDEILYKKKSAESAVTRLNTEIDNAVSANESFAKSKELLLSKREALLKAYAEINARKFEFNEDECKCPTCSQTLPETDRLSKRAELEENFNAESKRLLEANKSQGLQVKKEIETIDSSVQSNIKNIEYCKSEIERHNTEITGCNSELETLSKSTQTIDVEAEINSRLSSSEEIKSINNEIAKLEESLNNRPQVQSDPQKEALRQSIQCEIAELNKKLGNKTLIETISKRISELGSSERTLSQELASLEGQEFEMAQFIKAKMDIIEERVNSKFKIVRFKMFERQINGGEVECCECLINGVPFSDANTASKINAGLDIINTLSIANNVTIPVFIDNRESVSEIIPMAGQVINLFVSAQHKSLTI